MTAADIHAEVIELLDAGSQIQCAERLKTEALAIAATLAPEQESGHFSNEQAAALREEILLASSLPSERLLAIALPAIEHDSRTATGTLPQCIAYLAGLTSLVRGQRQWRHQIGSVVVGRILWGITAFALYSRRIAALSDLTTVFVENPAYETSRQPILESTELRYASGVGGDAGESYRVYREWLDEIDLVSTCHPMFKADLVPAFDEADFVIALLTEPTLRGTRTIYSEGFTTQSVERFRARLQNGAQRSAIGELFNLRDAELDSKLSQRYERLKTNPNRFSALPGQLLADRAPET